MAYRSSEWKGPVKTAAALTIAYFVISKLSLGFVVEPEGIVPLWLGSGLGLAALILAPKARWPLLLLAILVACIAANLYSELTLTASVGFALANVGEPALGAYLIRRFYPQRFSLATIPETVAFLGFAALSCAVAAVLGAAVAIMVYPGEPFLETWQLWFASDLLGALVVTPLILAWWPILRSGGLRAKLKAPVVREYALFCLALIATTLFIFDHHTDHGLALHNSPYWTLPLLLFGALRYGFPGSSITFLILTMLAMGFTLHGSGPYAEVGSSVGERILAMQFFIGINIASLLLLISAIRQRDQASRSLLDSERRFSQVIENSPVAMGISRDNQFVDYLNPAFQTTLAYSRQDIPTLDDWWQRAYPDEDYRREARARWEAIKDEAHTKGSAAEAMESRVRCGDGTDRWIEMSGGRLGDSNRFLVLFKDITQQKVIEEERKKWEERMQQTHKMEAIGNLAGGVAHDFNNMLGLILGRAELGMSKIEQDHPAYNDLVKIEQAALRSASLTQQLLAFARKQTIDPQVLNLNDAIDGTLAMLANLIGENIDLAWLPGTDVWPVKIDASQLDQMLTNMAVNARDAISDIGKITIETGNVSFDAEYCARHPGFRIGDFVLLAISDDGCGMDGTTRESIFEPFFTTKSAAEGTGLGLSMVYGIVKQNEGFINVYSEPGQGSTFRIYLPRSSALPDDDCENGPQPVADSQGECVLLVEDEPDLLSLNTEMLSELGYRVIPAASPVTALQLAERHAAEIDLLITDVVMPEMNGKELAKRLSERIPGIKVLFVSGYTANVIAHRGVLDEGVNYLQKPFSLRELAVRLESILRSAS